MAETAVADKNVKRFTVELEPRFHTAMRELARRKRVQIGIVYQEAIQQYLDKPDSFMGKDRATTTPQPATPLTATRKQRKVN